MSSLGDPFPTDDVWKVMPWYERYLWEMNHRDENHYYDHDEYAQRRHIFFDAIRNGYKPDSIASSSYNTDSGWDNNVPHRGPAGLSEGQLIEILKRIKPRVMNEEIMLNRRPYLLSKGERLRRLQPQKTMPQYMIDNQYHQNMADRIRAEKAAGIFRYNRREPWRIDVQSRMLEPPESYFQRGNCRNEPGLRRSMGGGSKRRTKRNRRSKNKRSKRKSRSKRR